MAINRSTNTTCCRLIKILNRLRFKRLAKFFLCLCPECKDNGGGTGTGTGTGCTDSGGRRNGCYTRFKLARSPDDAIGKGHHRTGWHWVVQHLDVLSKPDGILFDDFFEQNFCYRSKPEIYTEPWITIFHHPAKMPNFSNQREDLKIIFEQSEEFKASLPNLKLAFALSTELGTWLRSVLPCPVIVLKHPAPIVGKKWDLEKWENTKDRKLIQVGYYLRNTRLYEQIDLKRRRDAIRRTRLWSNIDWLEGYDKTVEKYWKADGSRPIYPVGKNANLGFVTPSKYDELLESNVVIAEYFAASASNVILDCIVRNTPIIVNPLDPIREYLGDDYPLYFNHPKEIPGLLKKIPKAHDYLIHLDETDFSVTAFIATILKSINELKIPVAR